MDDIPVVLAPTRFLIALLAVLCVAMDNDLQSAMEAPVKPPSSRYIQRTWRLAIGH